MKKILIILTVICLLFSFMISTVAYNVTPIPNHSGFNYIYMFFDPLTDDYILYLYQYNVRVYKYNSSYWHLQCNQNTYRYIYKINLMRNSSPYFLSWTMTTDNEYIPSNTLGGNVKNFNVIYTLSDIYDTNNVLYFDKSNNQNISNLPSLYQSNDTPSFDDSGIIAGLSSLGDKLDSLLLNVSENLQEIRDALYYQLDGLEIAFIDVFAELFTWLDMFVNIQYTLTNAIITSLDNIETYLDNANSKLNTMINQISTLPEDIAFELDLLLNPDSENLEGSFGGFVSTELETKFPIVEDIQSSFNSYSTTNNPILIEKTIKAGNMSLPVKIDFAWYEPYRVYVRTGMSGLFTMLMVIRAWAMISNVFSIGVNTGVSSYMHDNGLAITSTSKSSKSIVNKDK